MNDKIQELAEQANEYASQRATGDWEVGPAYQNIFNKKFAELIVKECLGVINKEHNEGIDRHGDYQLALYEAYREIKEHFGVEL